MSLFLSEQICHIMMATIGEPQNSRTKYSSTYNQTLLYGHPLNTDTSLLRTVCFVPGERKPLHFHYKNSTRLTLALPNVAKGKFLPNFQISFSKILRNKQHHVKVQAESFHLNGHIIGFRPQTKKLESPYKTPSNTLAVKGLIYMDTPLIRTLSMPLSVSVLSAFHRIPAIHSSFFPLPCQEQLGRKDYK